MSVSRTVSDIFSVRDLEIWVWDRSRSLKMAPSESFCTVSYSHFTMAVSLTVCEIFSV